ncbi:helix-turn-helix domain-containing protein [Kitasatospora sp. NPDC001574]
MPVEPTPRRRRLGVEIRRVREALGWTQEEAAEQLGYKALSTVSKIEKGVQGVKIQQLPHFFEVLGIDDPEMREQWRELVRNASEPDWWQRFGVVNDPLGDYLSEMEQANDLFVWNPVVLHLLLQTDDYERAVIEGSRAWKTVEEIDRFVAARREHRQNMLARSLKIWAVVPEGLLRQEVGGRAAARAQAEHLVHLMRADPNVTIQVLPFRAGAHAGMDGPFTLMSFPTGRDAVVVEAIRTVLHLNDQDTVEVYRTTADHLISDSLSKKASLSLLHTIAKDLS